MKRRIILVSGAILFITVGLFYFANRNSTRSILNTDTANEPASGQEDVATRETMPKPISKSIARSISSITPNEIKSLRATFPDKNEVKSEVGQDPHGTPKSLISFAESLGPLVEKALQNSDDATLLVDELYECTLSDTVAQSARALCLSKAEMLANIYPQLKEKTSKIRELAPSEVINLQKNKNLLIQK